MEKQTSENLNELEVALEEFAKLGEALRAASCCNVKYIQQSLRMGTKTLDAV